VEGSERGHAAAKDHLPGDGEVPDRHSGRLMSADQETHEDSRAQIVAEDLGLDGGGSSAERAGVNLIDDEPRGGRD
jgi:hypothetical protein